MRLRACCCGCGWTTASISAKENRGPPLDFSNGMRCRILAVLKHWAAKMGMGFRSKEAQSIEHAGSKPDLQPTARGYSTVMVTGRNFNFLPLNHRIYMT
jgi:hypothetical protein